MAYEGTPTNGWVEPEYTLPGSSRLIVHAHRAGIAIPVGSRDRAPENESLHTDCCDLPTSSIIVPKQELASGNHDDGYIELRSVAEPSKQRSQHDTRPNSERSNERQRVVNALPPVVEHSFLLFVNRVQGDRGAAVPAAVSHSSTQGRATRTADTARQKVLGRAA